MKKEDFEREYANGIQLIEAELERSFTNEPVSKLAEAMRYSLLAGGKRLRPMLVLQFCKAAGGDMLKALPAAVAVELLHTYSLIHDDLPCMDNDALRRGKPTNHVVYGECMATLAGDALQAEAFSTLLRSELPSDHIVKMAKLLADAAGLGGICLGQSLDMENEGRELTYDEISSIHNLKTASMLVASSQIGVAAGGGGEELMRAALDYASALGLAFQIRDDVLDRMGTTQELGKPAGSDDANHKTTFVTLFGISDCERLVREKTDEAVAALVGHFENIDFLETLARNLEERKY